MSMSDQIGRLAARLHQGIPQLLGVGEANILTAAERRHQVATAIMVGMPVGLGFVFFNYTLGFIRLAWVEGLASVVLLLAAYLLSQHERRVGLAEWLTLLWGGTVTAALVIFGGVEGSGVLWIFAFPFLAFFIKGQRQGWLISLFWIALCGLSLVLASQIESAWNFTPTFGAHLVGAMLWATLIAAAFNVVRAHFVALLKEQVAINTEKARAYLEKLQYLATHDETTALPNRAGLLGQLESAIASGIKDTEIIVVVNLHLERLLDVINIVGERGGQQLIRSVGDTLKQRIGEFGMLARTQADEFVAFYVTDRHNASAHRLQMAFEESPLTFVVEEFPIHLEHTLGCALYPAHSDNAADLLRKAEQALLQARQDKREVSFYDDQLDAKFIRRHRLLGQLRTALAQEELSLYFQPQMDLRTGKIVGAEALARWNRPGNDSVSPSEFIPVAEQSGLIKPFTKWVLNEFFRLMAEWHRTGLNLHFSVNLSARNLSDPDLVVDLATLMVKYGLTSEHIVLELTESSFAEFPDQLMKMATQLNVMGFQQSIDDFGTGYSSLSYLKDLPVNELKIDQSFIRSLTDDASSAAIVLSTIQLAHNLGLKVVAEGIETSEIAEQLKAAGCDIGQGYYFSRPLPPDEFEQFARARR